MKDYKNIEIKDLDYNLPDEKIAKYPLKNRDKSKLLIYKNKEISESVFFDIDKELPKNSLLIYNDTKVISARLLFKKDTGAKIEIFCLEPIEPSDYNLVFQSKNSCKWKCIVGNQKKWKTGKLLKKIRINETEILLEAEKLSSGANPEIKFSWNKNIEFGEILETIGNIPIPPYLNRESEEEDKKTYQTVYSKHKGSVAAPTAGLHFTTDVLNKLTHKGIKTEQLTLHVGAGTFKPVKSDTIGEHEMHFEHFLIKKSLIENLINNYGNIVAVGTTTVRTLESLYYIALKIKNNEISDEFIITQWEGYENNYDIDVKEALKIIINYMNKSKHQILKAKTQIIIVPGYKFKIINALITNFHQPKSTLLLLISAICGNDWKKIYQYALNNNFRFLSYGDSSLLFID